MLSVRLVTCICSRGLVHSRTMEAALQNLTAAGIQNRFLFTHDKPIPDAQNWITHRALLWRADEIWFVEEDMVPEVGTLQRMRELDKPVVIVDYVLPGGVRAIRRAENGDILFGGLGCALIKSEVFHRIAQPWFRTDVHYTVTDEGLKHTSGGDELYGRQDVHLFATLHAKGYKIEAIDGLCQHLKIKQYGSPETNRGCHEIAAL